MMGESSERQSSTTMLCKRIRTTVALLVVAASSLGHRDDVGVVVQAFAGLKQPSLTFASGRSARSRAGDGTNAKTFIGYGGASVASGLYMAPLATNDTSCAYIEDAQVLVEDLAAKAAEAAIGTVPEGSMPLESMISEPVDKDATESEYGANNVAQELSKKLIWDLAHEVHTPEEAAVSASLYMNPATTKIAENLKVTWEPMVANTIRMLTRISNPNRPFMVGIVGIPGSGKSTSAEIIAALLSEDDKEAIVMPMDGFHYSLADLAKFPNPADAVYRRGAPDTFDPAALAHALDRIAYGDEEEVSIPGFDHSIGDPTPDQHTFNRSKNNIVICEGIYLLHDSDGWETISKYFDWTIYIDADIDACVDRLKERNKCIPGYTPEEIEIRCDVVDRANAEVSRYSASRYASQIVQSAAR